MQKELLKINIGKKYANFGSEVFISSILIKRNIKLNLIIRKINDELQEPCKKYNFNYISDDVMTVYISQKMIWIF